MSETEELIPIDQWVQEHFVVAENILEFIKGIKSDLKELADGLGTELKIMAVKE